MNGGAFSSRWWKFNNVEFQNDYVRNLIEAKRVVGKAIRGDILESIKVPIEELDVGDSDILIFEIKQGAAWLLSKNAESVRANNTSSQQISRLMQDYDISPVPRFATDSRYGLTGL